MHVISALAFLAIFLRSGDGNILIPTSDEHGPQLHDTLLPNRRESITDCHYRYYKYGKNSLIKPAYGQPAFLREFAHMGAIGWTKSDGTIQWNCGGSLIWENYILTAAHCSADDDNMAPDVARFGDINLLNDTDDQYVQQLKIVEIIRHPEFSFRARYHDIALMRLAQKIKLHDTVAPACLWKDDEIRFKSLEATGWGDTGFAESRTPNLLKVSLRPVPIERCNQHYLNLRGLGAGLHTNQICAGDALMDTCPGDSGGPLQVKLLHNTRLTPFVVGVTSFGTACGLSVPGVYTRVAPYVPWIRSVLGDRGEDAAEWKFEPQGCAARYVQLREFEPSVVLYKGSKKEELDFSNAHIFTRDNPQSVSIHWRGPSSKECYGVIIDERAVVTLARCTTDNGVPPDFVRYLGTETNAIIRHLQHPNWTENSLYGDVGLLMLKDPFRFSPEFHPACIWERSDIPGSKIEVIGRGLLALNALFDDPVEDGYMLSNQSINLIAIADVQGATNCTVPQRYESQLGSGLAAEHLCFGDDPFLVPDTCEQAWGGPVQQEVTRLARSLEYVLALNLFGRDCGFGESAVSVRLGPYVPWLQSILLPKQPEPDIVEKFVFLNHDLQQGDDCRADQDRAGACMNALECPKVLHDFRENRPVRFCHTGSLLCCPREDIRNGTDAEWREIDSCEAGSNAHERAYFKSAPYVVWIILKLGEETRVCLGTIITSRTFLTAASCFDDDVTPEFVSIEDREKSMVLEMSVRRYVVHPEYEKTTKRHNIALVTVQSRIEASFRKMSACLWNNATHTPFYLHQAALLEDAQWDTIDVFTQFSSECGHTFGRELESDELCVFVGGCHEEAPVDEGMPAFWVRKGSGTSPRLSYLIGIMNYRVRNDSTTRMLTRIQPYVSWIKSVL